ncbi:MAG: S8 family serine peptidase [Bacteroidales bacterium]
MKKIFFSVLLLFVFNSSSAQMFYYSYYDTIHLYKTNTYLLKGDKEVILSYVNQYNLCVINANNIYTKVCIEGDVQMPENIIMYPAYKTIDNTLLCCTDELVFRLTDNMMLDYLVDTYKLEVIDNKSFYTLAKVKESADVISVSNEIFETGLVEYAHPNFVVDVKKAGYIPSDPYFTYQFYLHSIGQLINDGHYTTVDADINAPEAWEITKGCSSITVAVIDQGVTSNHPDLPNEQQIRLDSCNFAAPYDNTNVNDPSPIENYNHGNACAGIIAATHDNDEGIAGIAPNCKIMPIKVCGGLIPVNVFANAIRFAVDNGADVISNSWCFGRGVYHPVILNAIRYATTEGRDSKGCIVTFAVGNTANRNKTIVVYNDDPNVNLNDTISEYNNGIVLNWDTIPDYGYVAFPASCSLDSTLNLIAVGASDRDNYVANYSPRGTSISVVAPSNRAFPIQQMEGEDSEIWTIDIPGDPGMNPRKNNIGEVVEVLPNTGTNYLSYTGRFGGTSAACPQVSGIAALMLSIKPELTAKQVKKIIESTAQKVRDSVYNYSPHNHLYYPNGTWNNDIGLRLS